MKYRLISLFAWFLAVVSLICLVAWPYSYFYADVFAWQHQDVKWDKHAMAGLVRGSISVDAQQFSVSLWTRPRRPNGPQGWLHTPNPEPDSPQSEASRLTHCGFAIHFGKSRYQSPGYTKIEHSQFIAFPVWFPMLVCAPSAWILFRMRHKMRAALRGCCAKCGYDLRASPDRCPECGTPPVISPA